MTAVIRAARWFLIGAPGVAGILLLIFGTAGSISVAFGATLIGLSPLIWLANWFVRMTFDDDSREQESDARERRGLEQRAQRERAKRHPPHRTAPRRLGQRRRRRPQ
jgi:hypothetical protein